MRKIYKYPLEFKPSQLVEMPGNPVLFKVGLDPAGKLCVWASVNPEEPKRGQEFFIRGTGDELPEGAYIWLGTVQQGPFMWHVFTP